MADSERRANDWKDSADYWKDRATRPQKALADNPSTTPTVAPELHIFYDNAELNGQTIISGGVQGVLNGLGFFYLFPALLSISSIVHTWSVSPASMAGVTLRVG